MSRRSATTASRRRRSVRGRTSSSRSQPGVELVLEAYEGYWRKPASVKRLVLKVIPEEATRLAALKRGEVDIAYSIRGELAEELQAHAGADAEADGHPVAVLAVFPGSVGPEVAMARRARAAGGASGASICKTINQALTLGFSHVTRQPDPGQFRILLEAAGAGVRSGQGEAAAGRGRLPQWLRCRLLQLRQLVCEPGRGDEQLPRCGRHPGEAAAAGARCRSTSSSRDKKLKNIIQGGSGSFGNAATRFETFVVKGGAYVYGSYPDLDAMFEQQAVELDHGKRADDPEQDAADRL